MQGSIGRARALEKLAVSDDWVADRIEGGKRGRPAKASPATKWSVGAAKRDHPGMLPGKQGRREHIRGLVRRVRSDRAMSDAVHGKLDLKGLMGSSGKVIAKQERVLEMIKDLAKKIRR